MSYTKKFQVGEIVRYSNPEDGEENFRFRVVEDNGDRVHIEDFENKGHIKPVELVHPDDIETTGMKIVICEPEPWVLAYALSRTR